MEGSNCSEGWMAAVVVLQLPCVAVQWCMLGAVSLEVAEGQQ